MPTSSVLRQKAQVAFEHVNAALGQLQYHQEKEVQFREASQSGDNFERGLATFELCIANNACSVYKARYEKAMKKHKRIAVQCKYQAWKEILSARMTEEVESRGPVGNPSVRCDDTRKQMVGFFTVVCSEVQAENVVRRAEKWVETQGWVLEYPE